MYEGTQKDNIKDCIFNGHRVGNLYNLIKKLTFCPASNFISYCGHLNKSKCLNKFFWFKKCYINDYQSITTKDDECNPVE